MRCSIPVVMSFKNVKCVSGDVRGLKMRQSLIRAVKDSSVLRLVLVDWNLLLRF